MNSSDILSPVKRFFNLLRVEKQEILSIYVYALFNGIVTLSLPLGIQAIISLLTGGQVSTSWIILVVFVILGVGFTGIMQVMQMSISENLQQKIFTRSAFEFAYRIPRMKLEAMGKQYAPELVNRFFDTLSVQKGLTKILMDFSSASLQVVFGLILLSFYHPFFIVFSFILVVIVYVIFRFTAPQGLRTSLTESKYKYEVAHWLEEVARAMETFKLAGNSPLPMTKTDEAVSGYLVSRKAHFKTLLIQYVNLVAFKVLVAAGLLLIGGLLVINQQMNIGQFVASEIIILLILNSVEKLILNMETIYDVLTALEKIGYVTDIPLEREDKTMIKLSKANGLKIKAEKLSYGFGKNSDKIIKGVSFSVSPKEKVCLSGESGSGKSLLLQLLAGLFDDFSGTLSYNDIPLGNVSKEDLYSLMGDNLAKEDIFIGTLQENISLGKENITIEQIQQAAVIVGLESFIEKLPEGYNTLLAPEGKNLPKNVRLKIMLARAIVGNPKLILLEDNFNQLHERDKASFLNHLLNNEATVIAISNNIDTAAKFNKNVVMQTGTIVYQGKLDEAVSNESWYKTIFQIQ